MVLLNAMLLKNTEQLSGRWIRTTCKNSRVGKILVYGVLWTQGTCIFIVWFVFGKPEAVLLVRILFCSLQWQAAQLNSLHHHVLRSSAQASVPTCSSFAKQTPHPTPLRVPRTVQTEALKDCGSVGFYSYADVSSWRAACRLIGTAWIKLK